MFHGIVTHTRACAPAPPPPYKKGEGIGKSPCCQRKKKITNMLCLTQWGKRRA